jgi:hypothetical protein
MAMTPRMQKLLAENPEFWPGVIHIVVEQSEIGLVTFDADGRHIKVDPVQFLAGVEHPAHRGHEFGGGYARLSAMLDGDPDWMNATKGEVARLTDAELLAARGDAYSKVTRPDLQPSYVIQGLRNVEAAVRADERRRILGEQS